jgi:hypothetical protein
MGLLNRLAIFQYQPLTEIQAGKEVPGLGLPRAARLPILTALHSDLSRPILLITDRADHALALYDELGFWLKSARYLFPEPAPLFYEEAAWGASTRRDRQTRSAPCQLITCHCRKTRDADVIVASAFLMARTLPRDYLKACKNSLIKPTA